MCHFTGKHDASAKQQHLSKYIKLYFYGPEKESDSNLVFNVLFALYTKKNYLIANIKFHLSYNIFNCFIFTPKCFQTVLFVKIYIYFFISLFS